MVRAAVYAVVCRVLVAIVACQAIALSMYATLPLPPVLCDEYAKHTTLVALSALVLSQLFARVHCCGTDSDTGTMPPLTKAANLITPLRSSPSHHGCSCALI
eukprot:9336-Heterococcus_DN1.PRE.2